MACLTDLAGNVLTDNAGNPLTDIAGSDCEQTAPAPGSGKHGGKHSTGGAIYKIVNTPGG